MVMRTMREQTKWIMLLTAIAFVALMVFEWGMDLSGQSSAQLSGGELGRVNGEVITYDEYLPVYRGLYDQRQAEQEEPLTSTQNRQVEDAAWDQLVMDALVRQELRRRGIRVTPEEIRQAARYAPPPDFMSNEMFLTEGQFDLAKYHAFLASPAVDDRLLSQLEQYYRDVIPRNKLYQQVVSGLYVTDSELWRLYRDRNESARVEYIALDPRSRFSETDVTVSEQEIEQYYRANQEEFERPANAVARVVSLAKAPSAADSVAGLERARAVRQEIVEGADFAEVAERESQDPGSAARGGELGTFQRGQMVPAFDQAAWTQPVGQVGEPVLTQFGYHIIQVESRDGDEATARHILLPIEASPETEDHQLLLADSLEALGEMMPLDSAAARLGLQARTVQVNPEMPFAPGVGRLDEGADWIFEELPEEQALAGTTDTPTSPVFENQQAFYMVEVLEQTPAGVLPLDQAAPTIRTRLVTRKLMDLGREFGEGLLQEIRAGKSLQEVASANNLEVQEAGPFTRLDFVPGLGQANPVVGTAFGLPVDAVSGVVEGDNNLFILKVLERTPADREAWEEQKELQRARVSQSLQQEVLNRYLSELRDQAEILDSRSQVMGPAAAVGT